MSGTPGGFAHAPVTKGLLLASAGATLAMRALSASHAPRAAPALLRALAFRAPSEALFACLLLYHFRVLERQRGSAKYGGFCLR